jgi:hypothetical protein
MKEGGKLSKEEFLALTQELIERQKMTESRIID